VAVKVLEPALVSLRFSDGMKGGSMGKLYDLLLQLKKLYGSEIEGLDDDVRAKVHDIFISRWSAFHSPVFAAAYTLSPEFCRREVNAEIKKEVHTVMLDLVKLPGAPTKSNQDLKAEWSSFQMALGRNQVFDSVVLVSF